MKIAQFRYIPETGWNRVSGPEFEPDVLLAFGSGRETNGEILIAWWKKNYPDSDLIGCSTAGEILDISVEKNTIVVTAIKFERAKHRIAALKFSDNVNSSFIAAELADQIPKDNLKLCFVLSDGLFINGSRLVEGLNKAMPEGCLITGGLAGDGKRFQETQVCINEDFGQNRIVALCVYGDGLEVLSASKGGWSPFGPDRLISKSSDNQLFELDGQSALELYKDYLGDYAAELPSSGLRFPLEVTMPDGKKVVRTLLAVDEVNGSMTFAGDIPEGAYARFMHASYDRLVDGAQHAADIISDGAEASPDLAILVSCVGRRLVLAQRVEEEIEAVRDSLGDRTVITGYYSYGELCPLENERVCSLHNQTMTITTLREV